MKILDIEYTPNPNAVKFIVDEPLTTMGHNRTFNTVDEAEDVELAKAIFAIDGVESVYFAGTWLTVTQNGGHDWRALLRVLAEPIRAAEGPRLASSDAPAQDDDGERPGMDDPRVALIQQIQTSGDKTIMLVEHNMNVVMSVSDTITVMHQGAVLAEGSPAEIAANETVQKAYLGDLYGELSHG